MIQLFTEIKNQLTITGQHGKPDNIRHLGANPVIKLFTVNAQRLGIKNTNFVSARSKHSRDIKKP